MLGLYTSLCKFVLYTEVRNYIQNLPICSMLLSCRSWCTSVSTVSDYRLDVQGSIPGRGKEFFSSLCVQISSEAQPASYPKVTAGKARPGHDADHSRHVVSRSRMNRSYTSSPACAFMAVAGQIHFTFYYPVTACNKKHQHPASTQRIRL
jgi:hypothetical protein